MATFHVGQDRIWVDVRRDEALRKAGVYGRRPKEGKPLDEDVWVDVALHDLGDAIEVENLRTGQVFGRVNLVDVGRVALAMRSFAGQVRGDVRFCGRVIGSATWSADLTVLEPTVSLWLALSDGYGIDWRQA